MFCSAPFFLLFYLRSVSNNFFSFDILNKNFAETTKITTSIKQQKKDVNVN